MDDCSRTQSHCQCQAQTQTGGSSLAHGTQALTMARPMSYLASPYRPWGHPVTYKFAAELEGFGIFPSLVQERRLAGTVDSLFCRKYSARRVLMVSSQLIVQVKYEKSSTNCQTRDPPLVRPDFQLRFG